MPPRPFNALMQPVQAACTYCRGLKLKCDHQRPCNRCILTNRSATCVSHVPNQRGRRPKPPKNNNSDETNSSDIGGKPNSNSEGFCELQTLEPIILACGSDYHNDIYAGNHRENRHNQTQPQQRKGDSSDNGLGISLDTLVSLNCLGAIDDERVLFLHNQYSNSPHFPLLDVICHNNHDYHMEINKTHQDQSDVVTPGGDDNSLANSHNKPPPYPPNSNNNIFYLTLCADTQQENLINSSTLFNDKATATTAKTTKTTTTATTATVPLPSQKQQLRNTLSHEDSKGSILLSNLTLNTNETLQSLTQLPHFAPPLNAPHPIQDLHTQPDIATIFTPPAPSQNSAIIHSKQVSATDKSRIHSCSETISNIGTNVVPDDMTNMSGYLSLKNGNEPNRIDPSRNTHNPVNPIVISDTQTCYPHVTALSTSTTSDLSNPKFNPNIISTLSLTHRVDTTNYPHCRPRHHCIQPPPQLTTQLNNNLLPTTPNTPSINSHNTATKTSPRTNTMHSQFCPSLFQSQCSDKTSQPHSTQDLLRSLNLQPNNNQQYRQAQHHQHNHPLQIKFPSTTTPSLCPLFASPPPSSSSTSPSTKIPQTFQLQPLNNHHHFTETSIPNPPISDTHTIPLSEVKLNHTLNSKQFSLSSSTSPPPPPPLLPSNLINHSGNRPEMNISSTVVVLGQPTSLHSRTTLPIPTIPTPMTPRP